MERFRDRGSSDLVVDPTADCPLAADDAVIVLGHGNELPELKKCYTEKREITYRGAKLQV